MVQDLELRVTGYDIGFYRLRFRLKVEVESLRLTFAVFGLG